MPLGLPTSCGPDATSLAGGSPDLIRLLPADASADLTYWMVSRPENLRRPEVAATTPQLSELYGQCDLASRDPGPDTQTRGIPVAPMRTSSRPLSTVTRALSKGCRNTRCCRYAGAQANSERSAARIADTRSASERRRRWNDAHHAQGVPRELVRT